MAKALTTAQLKDLAARLAAMPPAVIESENVDRLRLLEDLKGICAAAQAREAVALDESRRADEAGRGIAASMRGRGVANEIALARRDGPSRGSRHLGLARALVRELPHTMSALRTGSISEWRATLVCRETAWLPAASRTRVDELLAPELHSLGDKAVAAKARALAQSIDPAEAVRHLRHMESGRRVSIRPAPDTMVHLTALLPMAQGVAAWANLDRTARTMIGIGEAGERTRGQLMADTLVERLTGQATANAVPVEVHLVMTDVALFGRPNASGSPDAAGTPDASGSPDAAGTPDASGSPNASGSLDGADPSATSAWLLGQGPLPAAAARDLLDAAHDGPAGGLAGRSRVWLRRLYSHPETGQLVAMDSRRRVFDGGLRQMIMLRDDCCRTPWCDAPIRHLDHAEPHAAGGETSYGNGSGLCVRCNLDKEALRWHHRATADHLTVITPTGHTHSASSPPLVRGLVSGQVRGPTALARPPGPSAGPEAEHRQPDGDPRQPDGDPRPQPGGQPPLLESTVEANLASVVDIHYATLRRELRAG